MLGKLVFESASARKKLNRATHPAVTWELAKQLFLCFVQCKRLVVSLPAVYLYLCSDLPEHMCPFDYRQISPSCLQYLSLRVSGSSIAGDGHAAAVRNRCIYVDMAKSAGRS